MDRIQLSQISTDGREQHGVLTQAEADQQREALCQELVRLQDMLFSREEHAVVMLFQGMDGAGKDGTLKVTSSMLDPQSCHAHHLDKPSQRELKHDYLRRYVEKLPMRGQIGMFNRSYYEALINGQVEPERLQQEKLPETVWRDPDIWPKRYRQVNDFERYLHENGYLVLKFFMHLSPGEQRNRFLERLEDADKHWKFSPNDMQARKRWDRYQQVYEELLNATHTEHAPWRVIPADHRWLSGLLVVRALLECLRSLNLSYPQPDDQTRQQMEEARRELENESASEINM